MSKKQESSIEEMIAQLQQQHEKTNALLEELAAREVLTEEMIRDIAREELRSSVRPSIHVTQEEHQFAVEAGKQLIATVIAIGGSVLAQMFLSRRGITSSFRPTTIPSPKRRP